MENENNYFQTIKPPVKGGVTIRNKKGFSGLYSEYKSEPTKLGLELWLILQENWKSLGRLAGQMLQYGYWEDYLNDGICLYCGKHDVGHCNSASGDLVVKMREGEIAPDPLALKHTHVPSTPMVSSENEEQDGLHLQWIYVIDPENSTLEVLKSVRKRGTCISMIRNRKYRQESYQYFPVGIFSLHDNMPDWDEVEQRGLDFAKFYHEKYQAHQTLKNLIL